MKLGVVGSGSIVRVVLELWKKLDIEVGALWCREQDLDQGCSLKEEFGIPVVYTDYGEFLADDSYDTVYVGLVNSLHFEYSLGALEAGKHVVCEKPFTSTAAQARKLIDTARGNNLFVFESILPWYQENYREIRRRLPELGDIKLVQCSLSQYSRRYAAYLEGTVLPVFDPMLDGGALFDMGTYSVHWVMGLFGVPKDVSYHANLGYNGIDVSGVLVLDYGSFKAVCMTAKDSTSPNRSIIQGDKGYLLQPTEPARCEGVSIVLNGQEPKSVDIEKLEDGFGCIWRSISQTMADRDFEGAWALVERATEVIDVMERARKIAGIRFSCD